MDLEIVFLGHDNSIDLILKADGTVQNLSSVTKMTLSFGDLLIESTNEDTDSIRWAKDGYATGEVRLFLGGEAIDPEMYHAPLVVYDETNDDGIVWGTIPISVEADVEAEAES